MIIKILQVHLKKIQMNLGEKVTSLPELVTSTVAIYN